MRSLSIERRPVPPRWFTVAVPVVAVLCAALIAAGFLALGGYDPIDVYRTMLDTAFGSRFAITETLVQATPLILTGLAAALAFRLQIWNIGGEGQLYLGAVVASGIAFALGDSLPAVPAIGLLLIAGAVGGGLYALLAGAPRADWGTDEIVMTLMFNFVALEPHQLPRVRQRERVARSGDVLVPAGTVPPRRVRSSALARPPGHRRARRRGGRDHRMVGAAPDALGVRVPGHRRLPRCGPLRRDQHPPQDRPDVLPVGCAGGSRRGGARGRPARLVRATRT